MRGDGFSKLQPLDNEDYDVCPECHKVKMSHAQHVCYTEIPARPDVDVLEDLAQDITKGFHGMAYSPIWAPLLKVGRLFYWFGAVPTCAALSVVSIVLYGPQFFATAYVHGSSSEFPVLLCFSWFVFFAVLNAIQLGYWLISFIPARIHPEWHHAIESRFWGHLLKREKFYPGLSSCTYALTAIVAIHGMFLVVAQQALISGGRVSPNFGLMMGVCELIHMIILICRLLAWSQDWWEDLFYMPAWSHMPKKIVSDSPYYEWEITANFSWWAGLYGNLDAIMGIFAVAVTFGLTEFDRRTDKVWTFFETFHPCVLIDHYPASLVGLFLIGLREVAGFLFNLMLFVFVYCKSGPIELLWSGGCLVLSQLLACAIVNAFSAQLYTSADLDISYANWKGLSDQDLDNIRQHTLSYCIWLAGSILLFAFQFRMMYRFKIPFGAGSWPTKILWHVFFVVGMLFTISMTAAMVVAINYQSMKWVDQPESFIQTIIGFMFSTLQGKYLMLMVAPVQRRLFPEDLGVKMRLSTNPERGKFGILGRSEVALSIVFWVLAFLVFATYLMDDNISTSSTLFPLAFGFREKPGVFLFAPAWFLCCMLLAYSVFVQVRESQAMGASPLRVLVMKVVGLWMVVSGLMCLFATIPLWEDSHYVSLSLLFNFPVWFFVAQGYNPRTCTYVAFYIILAVFSISVKPDSGMPVQASVISTCLLCVLLMSYPCWFKNNRPKLYCHFEVIPTTVVDRAVLKTKGHRYMALELTGTAPPETEHKHAPETGATS